MTYQPIIQNRWLRWAGVFALWAVIGLSFSIQFYLTQLEIGRPVTWGFALGQKLGESFIFAFLSLPSLWLARRIPIERIDWRRRVTVHAAGSAVFSLASMVLRATQFKAFGQTVSFVEALTYALVATFFFNVLVYWVIIGFSHTIEYYRKYRERELRAVELEKRLAQARLQALQMQLNPHFLFNTLHSISALMHKDVEAADRMITRLSDLLRHTLEGTDTQEVTLREELEFLQRYLEIEQTRFGDRLSVELDIAPDTLDAWVPNLVLQPIVENAIRHGIEPHAKPGRIQLQARRDGGSLRLQVSDNGSGLAANKLPREGVGLSNTRKRLQQLYSDRFSFEFNNAAGGGLAVSVTIPFRAATDGATDGEPSNQA